MTPNLHFNESQFLKLLFLLADIQTWLDDLSKQTFLQIPLEDKKKLMRKTYYLTPTAMTHIIERHYYKINRHPQAGKFHVPVIDILQLIRDASSIPAQPMAGSLNLLRTLQTTNLIGYDNNGQLVNSITILTDPAGRIITAFPGELT